MLRRKFNSENHSMRIAALQVLKTNFNQSKKDLLKIEFF